MATIGIDVDGTMYQYHTAFVYMARHYLGVNMPPAWAWDSWDWPYQYLTESEAEWMRTTAVELGLYRYGHIMKGAIVAIRELAREHDIIAITHRPRNAVPDTLAWLTYADLPLSGVHILTERQAKSVVAYDVLIDDKPANVEDAIGHGRIGVLFDQPWNKEYHARYCSTWAGMGDEVAEALRS